jgi:hypothetical protein
MTDAAIAAASRLRVRTGAHNRRGILGRGILAGVYTWLKMRWLNGFCHTPIIYPNYVSHGGLGGRRGFRNDAVLETHREMTMKKGSAGFKSHVIAAVLTAAMGAAMAPAANAVPTDFTTAVPSEAYILYNGLYWAWAAPTNGGLFTNTIDFSVQGAYGWRLPTASELASAPSASAFLFPGANVPDGGFDPNSGAVFTGLSGSDGACAASYFYTGVSECNFDNAPGQANGLPWAGQAGANDFSEVLVVMSPTPVPAALPLMLTGIAGIGYGVYRNKKKTKAAA